MGHQLAAALAHQHRARKPVAHAVALRRDDPVRGLEAGPGGGREVGVVGPGQHAHHRRPFRQAQAGRARGAASRLAHGQQVAVAQGPPPQAAEAGLEVGAARAQHRLDRDAAADRDIAAHAASRSRQLQHLARVRGAAPAGPQRPAVETGVGVGAGQRDPGVGLKPQDGRAERELQAGGARRIAHQQIAGLQRQLVQRAAEADATVAPARPAQVLDGGQRPRAQHLDHGRSATKRTRSPGASSVGGSA
mmetsp:Transcript_3722/g.10234  ORF Transcript_3722/g.10234 Transcript_3722/m.10234 type:complete len:248 (+) Transcript_3722:728-1471(+)